MTLLLSRGHQYSTNRRPRLAHNGQHGVHAPSLPGPKGAHGAHAVSSTLRKHMHTLRLAPMLQDQNTATSLPNYPHDDALQLCMRGVPETKSEDSNPVPMRDTCVALAWLCVAQCLAHVHLS